MTRLEPLRFRIPNSPTLRGLCRAAGLAGLLSLLLTGCQTPTAMTSHPPLRAIDRPIELSRFMGDWYVIAHLPTFIERRAYNAVERYDLAPDGTIATTFTFNQGAPDGPLKTYRPRGFVHNAATRTDWRMQFVWPFKAAYLIVYLDDNYETTVIGVPGRRYAWIMARSPLLDEEQYAKLVDVLRDTGHDLSRLRRVPHDATGATP